MKDITHNQEHSKKKKKGSLVGGKLEVLHRALEQTKQQYV
jgi:hypothetical protein